MAVLGDIESILLAERGWVSSLSEGDTVVLLLSGGLDSGVAVAWLAEELGVSVFPLFVRRGQRAEHSEAAAIVLLDDFFAARYSDRVRPTETVAVSIPATELKTRFDRERVERLGHPMRESSLTNVGVQYATTLTASDGSDVRTVLVAEPVGVGATSYPHSSLLALRAQTLTVAVHMGDWRWQITSPFSDPMVCAPLSKADLVRWAKEHRFPLFATTSCYSGGDTPCGQCPSCRRRAESFAHAYAVTTAAAATRQPS